MSCATAVRRHSLVVQVVAAYLDDTLGVTRADVNVLHAVHEDFHDEPWGAQPWRKEVGRIDRRRTAAPIHWVNYDKSTSWEYSMSKLNNRIGQSLCVASMTATAEMDTGITYLGLVLKDMKIPSRD